MVGGTSASAPLWAALAAMTNALPGCGGVPIGFVNPALYSLAGSDYAYYFNDVAAANYFSGASSNDLESLGRYPVGVGYDMTTGLGTPHGWQLAGGLCSMALAAAHRECELECAGQAAPRGGRPSPKKASRRFATYPSRASHAAARCCASS